MIEIFPSAIKDPELKFADLHIHTNMHQPNGRPHGRMSPEQVVDFALKTGFLSAVAITEHDSIAPALQAQKYAQDKGVGLEVVVGSEVSTKEGHLLGHYLKEDLPKNEHFYETIYRIHDQDGLVIIPHPLFKRVPSLKVAELFEFKEFPGEDDFYADGYEVFNAGMADISPEGMEYAAHFYEQMIFNAAIGSSDSHRYTIGRGLTSYRGNLKDAIRVGSTRAYRLDLNEQLKLVEIAREIFPGIKFQSRIQKLAARRLGVTLNAPYFDEDKKVKPKTLNLISNI